MDISVALVNIKGPFKRIKHVGQTSNTVGRNEFHPFEKHNQICWIVLDGVGLMMLDEVSLCSNFSSNIVQNFRSRDQ